ncbi:MAG: NAD(P)-dependent oxidoreductase [Rhodobacteraceae bacterium]|nr:NAD(P)-dependent oxidoreductase [Paracoccaceae bacterium]
MTQVSNPAPHLLVTGAAGFVGRAVVSRARALGLSVTAVTRQHGDQRDPRWLAALVADTAPDIAIDAAGIIPGTRQQDVAQNIALTQAWLDALGQLARPPRLVLSGSAAVYGKGAATGRATRETDPMQPSSDYGRAKLAALEMAHEAHQKHGLDVQTGIIFNLVGAGQACHLAPQVFIGRAMAASDQPLGVANIGDVRDFVDVDDVADALIAMALRSQAGSVANVATGKPTRISDLLTLICTITGREWQSIKDPVNPTPNYICYGDPSLLHAMTGWTPKFDLRQSLNRAILAHEIGRPSPC